MARLSLHALGWVIGGWLGCALGVTGCFSEAEPMSCPKGATGCRCNDGQCGDGLVCTMDYCILEDCTPGTKFCSCGADGCEDDLLCMDGAICWPPGFATGDDGSGGGNGAGNGDDAVDDGDGDDGQVTGTSTSPSDGDDTVADVDAGSTDGIPSDCGPAAPCPECYSCVNGSCMVDFAAPCTGAASLECSELVFGAVDGVCRAFAPALLPATCNAQGQCVEPFPTECPMITGATIFACHEGCVDNPAACAMYQAVFAVNIDDMCAINQPGPGCFPTCQMTGSIAYLECNGNGQCPPVATLMPCGGFACDPNSAQCLTECMTNTDCAIPYCCNSATQACQMSPC